jgi:hypothetical protein
LVFQHFPGGEKHFCFVFRPGERLFFAAAGGVTSSKPFGSGEGKRTPSWGRWANAKGTPGARAMPVGKPDGAVRRTPRRCGQASPPSMRAAACVYPMVPRRGAVRHSTAGPHGRRRSEVGQLYTKGMRSTGVAARSTRWARPNAEARPAGHAVMSTTRASSAPRACVRRPLRCDLLAACPLLVGPLGAPCPPRLLRASGVPVSGTAARNIGPGVSNTLHSRCGTRYFDQRTRLAWISP